MEYKSDLKKHLKTAKLKSNNISYELSYEKVKDLNYLNIEEILRYINDNYINDKKLKKEDLINDLIAFKSYKDEIEVHFKIQDLFEKVNSFQITVFFTLISLIVAFIQISSSIAMFITDKASDKSFFKESLSNIQICLIFIIYVLIVIIIANMIYYFIRNRKNSKYNKLMTINNAIHILEALKDEMVDENKILENKDFNLVVNNVEGDIEPYIYSVKVRESLERKSK